MTRIEFLGELSRRLSKLPKEELDDVLSYYDEIFFDAGVENEAETSEKLGNIDDIARQILIDNNIAPDGEPEYFVQQKNGTQGTGAATVESKAKSNNNIAGKLLILVLTFPIWLPVLITVVSVAFSLLVAAAAIVFALIISGVVCVGVGFAALFFEPVAGLITLGIGLVLCGLLGLVGVPLCKWLFRVLKDLFNSICTSFHNFIEKRRSA